MRRAFAIALLVIAGCAPVDRAALLVSLPPMQAETAFPAASAEPRMRSAFENHTKGLGYSCHSAMTSLGRYVCRGPKDLHLTFEPRLDGAGYVAGLSWVRSEDRSAEEFSRLVQQLEHALQATGASVEVRMGEFAE